MRLYPAIDPIETHGQRIDKVEQLRALDRWHARGRMRACVR
jgi:hypothetical protein